MKLWATDSLFWAKFLIDFHGRQDVSFLSGKVAGPVLDRTD